MQSYHQPPISVFSDVDEDRIIDMLSLYILEYFVRNYYHNTAVINMIAQQITPLDRQSK